MIVYKWVIKKDSKYYPIVNNGAYKPFTGLDLGYYEIGKTYTEYKNPNLMLEEKRRIRYNHFHRPGFHFWKYKNHSRFSGYQKCIKQNNGTPINCTLKCKVEKEDIINENNDRIVAEKFKVIGELC